MKSKLNSKYKAQWCQQQTKAEPQNKISLLINSKAVANLFTCVPLHFSANVTYLDLSNNNLSSLEGIERYSKLEKLNVSSNRISEYQGLSNLSFCHNFKQIDIQNNPISTKLNFHFILLTMLQKVVKVNGIQVDCSLRDVTKWQRENGYKIAVFLLQSCMVFDSILKSRTKFDVNKLQSELSRLEALFHEQQSNINDFMKTSNFKICDHLPLNCVEFPEQIESELTDIKDYYIQKLLQADPKQGNEFVAKILQDIEVADEEQEKQLSNRVQFTRLVLKNQIQSAFYQSQAAVQNLSSKEDKLDEMRHFRSAQTALQTIDTTVRSKKDAVKFGIHFCLDFQYMQMAMTVMNREICRLVKVVSEYMQQDQYQTQILESTYHIKSFDDQNGMQAITSPVKVYNNFAILSNLIELLEMPVKRIAFRKIKTHKNKQFLNQVSLLFVNCLNRSIAYLQKQAIVNIKQLSRREGEVQGKILAYRMKRILLAWRNIHKKKMKLLKNIVKRKIKCDKFQLAIILTRWKMNSRADKIRRMASAVILGTRLMSVPKSKKGIELGYQRIVKNRGKVG